MPAVAAAGTSTVRVGPRGEGFRFAEHGAFRTFGLSGRRYSWIREVSVVPGREGRGPARARRAALAATPAAGAGDGLAAAFQRERDDEILRQLEEGQAVRRETAAAVAAVMQQLESMIHFWRDMPPVPTPAELSRAEVPAAFECGEPAPRPPDMEEARAMLEARIASGVRALAPDAPWLPLSLGASSALLAAAAVAALGEGPLLALSVAALAGVAAWGAGRAVGARLSRRLQASEVRRRMAEQWPGRAEQLAAAWRYDWAAWDLRRAEERVAWHSAESERVERVRRLRAGDPAASRACLEATLADLDFPYRATLELAAAGDTAFLLVDLPDVDRVVPPARAEVDEDLAVTEVPVAALERNEAYAEHVAGTALLLARASFAAAPALRRVQIAGYREGPDSAVEYVVDVSIDRESAARIDPARVDPDAYLAVLPGRFQETESYRLAPVPPPAWLAEAFGTYSLAVAAAAWKN